MKVSLPNIYAAFYKAMQHKVEEKNHKPVFLTFKIKQNFYIMRDSNNFLYNVTPFSALSPEAKCSWSSGAGFFSYLKSDAKFIVLFLSKDILIIYR